MQPTISNNDSRITVPYHVHNQTGFDNPFINGRDFIYFGILMMGLLFKYLSIRAARKANI